MQVRFIIPIIGLLVCNIFFFSCDKEKETKALSQTSNSKIEASFRSETEDPLEQLVPLGLLYDQIRFHGNEDLFVMEIPLERFDRTFVFDSEAYEANDLNVARTPTEYDLNLVKNHSASALVVNLKGGETKYLIAHYLPTKGVEMANLKPSLDGEASDFTGRVVITDLQGNIKWGKDYANGVTTAVFSTTEPSNVRKKECTTVTIVTTSYSYITLPLQGGLYEITIISSIDTYSYTTCDWGSGGSSGPFDPINLVNPWQNAQPDPAPCPPPSVSYFVPFTPIALTVPDNDVMTMLNCLRPNLTPGETYTIGVYVDQPVPGRPLSYKFNCPNMDLGMSYLYLETVDQGVKKCVTLAYLPTGNGIAVNAGTNPSPLLPGRLVSCGGNQVNVSFTKALTAAEYNQVLDNVIYFYTWGPGYNLNNSNNTDFVLKAISNLGLNLAPCSGAWPLGAGSSAGVLGERIRQLPTASNVSLTTTPHNAPTPIICYTSLEQ